MQSDALARPTLADVAARAGVSASTASLAFSGSGPVSDATKERVLAAAAELGYAGPDPRARSLRRGRSGIVGVVLEERVRAAFLDPVKIQMLDGITEGIAPLGAGLLLLTDTGEAGGNAVGIESAPVDAVVLVGCSPRLGVAVEVLRRRGIPAVAIEGAAGEGMPQISIDNRAATRRGAEYLRELGHTDVALVTLPFDADRTRGPLTPELIAASTADTASERLAGAREVFPDATGRVAAASSIEEGREAALRAAGRPGDAAHGDHRAERPVGGRGHQRRRGARHRRACRAQRDRIRRHPRRRAAARPHDARAAVGVEGAGGRRSRRAAARRAAG